MDCDDQKVEHRVKKVKSEGDESDHISHTDARGSDGEGREAHNQTPGERLEDGTLDARVRNMFKVVEDPEYQFHKKRGTLQPVDETGRARLKMKFVRGSFKENMAGIGGGEQGKVAKSAFRRGGTGTRKMKSNSMAVEQLRSAQGQMWMPINIATRFFFKFKRFLFNKECDDTAISERRQLIEFGNASRPDLDIVLKCTAGQSPKQPFKRASSFPRMGHMFTVVQGKLKRQEHLSISLPDTSSDDEIRSPTRQSSTFWPLNKSNDNADGQYTLLRHGIVPDIFCEIHPVVDHDSRNEILPPLSIREDPSRIENGIIYCPAPEEDTLSVTKSASNMKIKGFRVRREIDRPERQVRTDQIQEGEADMDSVVQISSSNTSNVLHAVSTNTGNNTITVPISVKSQKEPEQNCSDLEEGCKEVSIVVSNPKKSLGVRAYRSCRRFMLSNSSPFPKVRPIGSPALPTRVCSSAEKRCRTPFFNTKGDVKSEKRCHQCFKVIKEVDLLVHIKFHIGENEACFFRCSMCDYADTERMVMFMHFASYHSRCPFCMKTCHAATFGERHILACFENAEFHDM